jgi:chemotaxis protein MotB
MRLFASAALLLLAPVACVSAGDHEKLQADFDAQKAQLQETQIGLQAAQKKSSSLEAALAAEQKKSAALDASIKDLQQKMDAERARSEKLSGDMAEVLKDKSKLKSSVDDMQKALEDLAKRKAEADRRIAEFKSLLDRFKTLIDAGKLKVKIVDGRMVVALASDVLFASGSAQLSKDGKANIAEVGAVLATITGKKFQVEGHTDNVPIKTAAFPSNWELASARALTVVKGMIEGGMPADSVSAASFGDTKPAAPNDTPEGKAQNRRIEIVVVPDLSSLPGFDELQRTAS